MRKRKKFWVLERERKFIEGGTQKRVADLPIATKNLLSQLFQRGRWAVSDAKMLLPLHIVQLSDCGL